MKRLALFLDGTWDDPHDQTNVLIASKNVAARDAAGNEQVSKYLEGVGTDPWDKAAGGLGWGLARHVRQAYGWLVDRYEPGDAIYVFGFSRGAFTARSVCGMITTLGLLRRDASIDVDEAFARYKARKKEASALPLAETRAVDDSFFHSVRIRMIGAWETVGALGIPWAHTPIFNPRRYEFHDTYPSALYDACFHALALDEHRANYAPTLWTRYLPKRASVSELRQRPPLTEQRWFVGCHGNVGGERHDQRVQRVPLAWMMRRARECELAIDAPIVLDGTEHLGPIVDSYHGIWRLMGRLDRVVGAAPRDVHDGTAWSEPMNETIDATVFDRYRNDADYRREAIGLNRWAAERELDLMTVEGTQIARPAIANLALPLSV